MSCSELKMFMGASASEPVLPVRRDFQPQKLSLPDMAEKNEVEPRLMDMLSHRTAASDIPEPSEGHIEECAEQPQKFLRANSGKGGGALQNSSGSIFPSNLPNNTVKKREQDRLASQQDARRKLQAQQAKAVAYLRNDRETAQAVKSAEMTSEELRLQESVLLAAKVRDDADSALLSLQATARALQEQAELKARKEWEERKASEAEAAAELAREEEALKAAQAKVRQSAWKKKRSEALHSMYDEILQKQLAVKGGTLSQNLHNNDDGSCHFAATNDDDNDDGDSRIATGVCSHAESVSVDTSSLWVGGADGDMLEDIIGQAGQALLQDPEWQPKESLRDKRWRLKQEANANETRRIRLEQKRELREAAERKAKSDQDAARAHEKLKELHEKRMAEAARQQAKGSRVQRAKAAQEEARFWGKIDNEARSALAIPPDSVRESQGKLGRISQTNVTLRIPHGPVPSQAASTAQELLVIDGKLAALEREATQARKGKNVGAATPLRGSILESHGKMRRKVNRSKFGKQRYTKSKDSGIDGVGPGGAHGWAAIEGALAAMKSASFTEEAHELGHSSQIDDQALSSIMNGAADARDTNIGSRTLGTWDKIEQVMSDLKTMNVNETLETKAKGNKKDFSSNAQTAMYHKCNCT